MDRDELITKLTLAWKRAFLPYAAMEDLYALYLDDALTGFAFVIDKPTIGEFGGEKCILITLAQWQILRHLSADTVTPFRIVAQGKSTVVGAWQAHTGLKYAIRNTGLSPCTIHIPVSDFKPEK